MKTKILNKIRNISVLLVTLPVAFILFLYLWFLHASPLSFNEMDLNKNGWVSFSEADYTGNYGIKQIVVNGKTCTEYFAYKDGLPIKVMCNE